MPHFRELVKRCMRMVVVLSIVLFPLSAAGVEPGEGKENAVPSVAGDEKAGKAVVVNNWGLDFYQVTVRHRRGNDPKRQEEVSWYDLKQGEKSAALEFTYETGSGSPFDYWWVKFSVIGAEGSYGIKDDFYCSVSSDDDGEVTLTLDGDTDSMRVSFSSSSACSVGVSKD